MPGLHGPVENVTETLRVWKDPYATHHEKNWPRSDHGNTRGRVVVFGTLISRLRPGRIRLDGDSLLLTQTEFNREITRERVRATRRSIPFCVITIKLVDRSASRRAALIRILHRNLRLTDQKASLDRFRFGVLLVDTPEMGGRAVIDRLAQLFEARGVAVSMSLSVHDPEGFDPDDDGVFRDQNRRREDRTESWVRVDEASNPLERTNVTNACVTSEESLVERPYLSRAFKRSIDVVGASLGLLVLSPILLVSIAVVKWTSPGPAIFRQTREGRGGKPFTIFKIRTMVADAEQKQAALRHQSHRDGPAFKIENDPRVTPVGHLLRKTCIDELPQLVNVLKGEMSLVGPRPLPWHESRACDHWHRRRLDVRPGMTCYWQVNKGAAETFDDWMRMDLRYVDRHTFWNDLRLILRTVIVPFSGRGSE